jgi:PEP-CTERM/exosortase A-associated glycosyltransferase
VPLVMILLFMVSLALWRTPIYRICRFSIALRRFFGWPVEIEERLAKGSHPRVLVRLGQSCFSYRLFEAFTQQPFFVLGTTAGESGRLGLTQSSFWRTKGEAGRYRTQEWRLHLRYHRNLMNTKIIRETVEQKRVRPLRVLHVLDHSWPVLAGYAQRSRSIVTAQLQHGMEPSVITSPLHQIDDPSASDATFDGVRYFRTPHKLGLAGRAIQAKWPILRELAVVHLLRSRIKSLLKSESFDIVHAHSPALCGLAAAQAARSFRIPFVYEIRAFWEDAAVDQQKKKRTSLHYILARRLETYVVRRADAVVGIARSILQDLEARGIASEKLFHVSNGVDTLRFVPRVRNSGLAAALGLNGAPTLGFIGTLFPWEGIPWLVRAAVALRKRGTVFNMLIVGDGPEAGEVRKAIQESDAERYIFYPGRVPYDQIERYYSVMDVLVYPRPRTRLTDLVTPLKPLEAMALGKAILGSDVGGVRELVESEVTGVLFKPGDVQDFERQAMRLLQDPEFRRLLGDRARQRVAKDKDWKVLTRTYESVYATACRSASTRH